MPNLRVLYDNAADRVSSIVASNTAGSLSVDNLLTDIKTEIWRSTTTSPSLTLTWASEQAVNCVSLPFTNFSNTATLQVRGYAEVADSTPLFDTGPKLCATNSFGTPEWGVWELGANVYQFGLKTYATVYFPTTLVKKLVILINDVSNPGGYVEAGRVVVGDYWEPKYNANYGAQVGAQDSTKNERSDAGNLHSDRGTIHKTLTVDLQYMPARDRNHVWRMVAFNGLSKPVFLSLVPESVDSVDEEIHQIYGKMSRMSNIKYQFINQFDTQIELEEI